jgi:hypothetical protein
MPVNKAPNILHIYILHAGTSNYLFMNVAMTDYLFMNMTTANMFVHEYGHYISVHICRRSVGSSFW